MLFQVEPTWKPGLPWDRGLGTASDEILRGRLVELLMSSDAEGDHAMRRPAFWEGCREGAARESGAEEAALERLGRAGGFAGHRMWRESGDDSLIGTSRRASAC